MVEHESTKGPNWDTKIVCTCGERCSHWMEFYRHRGDAYKALMINGNQLLDFKDALINRLQAQIEAMKPHMPFAGADPWEGGPDAPKNW